MRAPSTSGSTSRELKKSRRAAWELVVQVDSLVADTSRILQGGARRDRPLFVLRELPLEPGAHHVQIRFTPENGLAENGSAGPMVFDSVLRIAAGEVALVTLERERGTFIVRRSIQATKGITE